MLESKSHTERKNESNPYSLHPFFPCAVYVDDKKHSDCCCKLEAKDTWFALVHLLGYPKEKVKIISYIDNEEVVL